MDDSDSYAARTLGFILDSSSDFVTLITRDYRYEVVNAAYCTAMEKERDVILGKTVAEVWGSDSFHSRIKHHLDQCLNGSYVEYVGRFSFGPFERNLRVTMHPYKATGENVTHVLVFTRDITNLSQVESRLHEYEYRDPTTGLLNRKSLERSLETALAVDAASATTIGVAVLFVKLSGIAEVNRIYGHRFGDLLLEDAALRIRKHLSPIDDLFRFNGDDLVVVCPENARKSDAAHLAQCIADAIAVPYTFQNNVLSIRAAIGIALFPDDAENELELIQHAASASAEASNHTAPFRMYNRSLHEAATSKLKLLSDLRGAFDEQQLLLYYQPIVDPEGRILGAEALIRWQHPELGLLPPGRFVGLAEESGLIAQLDRWVLFAAARQLAQWTSRPGFYVSVNLNAGEFAQPDLPGIVVGALKAGGVGNPAQLKLEITESCSMKDPALVVKRIHELREMGIDVWIDDFGTGYSSLSSLKQLPVPVLKLDRAFVIELDECPEDVVYVSTILNSVRSRGKETLIEGVETLQQYTILRRIGCVAMQGYYFSPPVPPEAISELIAADELLPKAL